MWTRKMKQEHACGPGTFPFCLLLRILFYSQGRQGKGRGQQAGHEGNRNMKYNIRKIERILIKQKSA